MNVFVCFCWGMPRTLRCMYTESCLIFVQLWDIDGTLTTLPAWFYSDWTVILHSKWRLFFVIALFTMILQRHSFWWGSSTWPKINHQTWIVNKLSYFHNTISNSISVTPRVSSNPTRMGTIPVAGPCTASLCVQTVQCHHYFGSTSAVTGPSGSYLHVSLMDHPLWTHWWYTHGMYNVHGCGWQACLAKQPMRNPTGILWFWSQVLGFETYCIEGNESNTRNTQ